MKHIQQTKCRNHKEKLFLAIEKRQNLRRGLSKWFTDLQVLVINPTAKRLLYKQIETGIRSHIADSPPNDTKPSVSEGVDNEHEVSKRTRKKKKKETANTESATATMPKPPNSIIRDLKPRETQEIQRVAERIGSRNFHLREIGGDDGRTGRGPRQRFARFGKTSDETRA